MTFRWEAHRTNWMTESRFQINFYRLEMDREQLDRMYHGQGKGPAQGEAPGERSGLRKVHETKTDFELMCSV